ncbi:MAG: response regulator [Bacteroidetes bacterium]|nr:response regulator [Bacteroidota bacterium]
MKIEEVKILLVEDNEGDIVLTLEGLREARIYNHVQVVKDGEQALHYLRKLGNFTDAETPNLILLDINLPRIDGKEVLMEIKNDPLLKKIPVVMLTTSESETDVLESYNNHANCYITKPVDYSKFMDVVHSIKDFWISIVHLPS